MLYFSDLHLHSKYSRAVSEKMVLWQLAEGARLKGLRILGTGDFTHPLWFDELKRKLVEAEANPGFYKLSDKESPLFMLTAEVSTIYSTPRGVKKVHHVIHVPSLEEAEQLNDVFARLGDLKADGRPTFGQCPPARLVETVAETARNAVIVPAHAWTPWFSVFGSMSGFDSLKEAFEDQSDKIFAIETGMSSDPAMNWRISALDGVALMSNSDSHSPYPWRLGRECNVFEFEENELSFDALFKAVREKDANHFKFTVEVDPNYGKYHYDGHRACAFSCSPEEAAKLKDVCPVCRRPLTIGVMHRVNALADRPPGFTPPNAIPFRTLLPLHELLAAVFGSALYSKKVSEAGDKLLRDFGSELNVLLNVPREELVARTEEKIADVILLNREGRLRVKPGFDGEYGVLELEGKQKAGGSGAPPERFQKSLSDYGE